MITAADQRRDFEAEEHRQSRRPDRDSRVDRKERLRVESSIERVTAEGKALVDSLQATVTVYQAKLEEAEQLASYDSMTQLRSRLWVERQIGQRIEGAQIFCAAIIDIDGFKKVNDDFRHLIGDVLLKEFATELRSACRSTNIGRWGGDEFMVLLDCQLQEAQAQIERLSK